MPHTCASLAAAALFIVAVGCAPGPPAAPTSPPAAATRVTVTYASINGNDLPIWIAAEGGIFQKNGLDATVNQASSTSASMASLLAGQTQFYQGGGSDAVSAAANGADVVVVCLTGSTYDYIFEVPPDIKTPQDLRGKTIGISSFGSAADVGIRVALRHEGLDPDKDVSIVPVGDVPTRTAAMLSGAIQGTILNPPDTLKLEAAGFHPLLDLAALKLPSANQATVVTRAYLNDGSNRATVQHYVDAIVQSVARLRADKPFAIELMKKYFKTDDQRAMDVAYTFYSQEVITPRPIPTVEEFTDAIAQLGIKDEKIRGFDASRIIDASFVQSALDRHLDQQPG
jgi:NitT/TauT family transport system substrate-binding protein